MMRNAYLMLCAVLAGFPSVALACNDHAAGTEPAHKPARGAASLAAGEVREVDLEEGTITLGHGRIASLGMAPMTSMLFKAGDARLLAKLKPGDKVNFRATMVGQHPTVIKISRAEK
jgi:Cu/Ag efflux protein CusF